MSDQKPNNPLPEIEASASTFTSSKVHDRLRAIPFASFTPQADLTGWDPERDLGQPGEPPYTRGIHPPMYRGRLWTMRQFAGFGTAEDTNARFRYLLAQGQTGPLRRLRSAHADGLRLRPSAVARAKWANAAWPSVRSQIWKRSSTDIPLAEVTTSMTINSPAAVIWAMYLAVAEKQGADWKTISGTLQNDILKEYIAQKEYIYPPEPSMRLVTDTIEFGARHTPRFNPISISGYHIREAGSTAIQELAFTLRDGIEYVERGLRRGLDVDDFAPRLSFFFNAHNDFFEEIAKYRAARRIWQHDDARAVWREESALLGAALPRADGGMLAHRAAALQQRGAHGVQALAAVLGGTQSLHTNSLDEAWALPTEAAATLALRTQQIIAHESGVTNTADPLGGSYFVETLTNEIERGAREYIAKIDALGGMVAAIERSLSAARNRRGRLPLSACRGPQRKDRRRRERIRHRRKAHRDSADRRVRRARGKRSGLRRCAPSARATKCAATPRSALRKAPPQGARET